MSIKFSDISYRFTFIDDKIESVRDEKTKTYDGLSPLYKIYQDLLLCWLTNSHQFMSKFNHISTTNLRIMIYLLSNLIWRIKMRNRAPILSKGGGKNIILNNSNLSQLINLRILLNSIRLDRNQTIIIT